MSTRTIIEINHDYLHDLEKGGHISHELSRFITDGKNWPEVPITRPQGVKVLGQRHHSETLKLVVK